MRFLPRCVIQLLVDPLSDDGSDQYACQCASEIPGGSESLRCADSSSDQQEPVGLRAVFYSLCCPIGKAFAIVKNSIVIPRLTDARFCSGCHLFGRICSAPKGFHSDLSSISAGEDFQGILSDHDGRKGTGRYHVSHHPISEVDALVEIVRICHERTVEDVASVECFRLLHLESSDICICRVSKRDTCQSYGFLAHDRK